MQREELTRRGIDPRLTHFVVEQGRTVTEHMSTLSPEERREFGELWRSGPWVMRSTSEDEAPPREISEAHQASIEFAYTIRNTDRQPVFRTPEQAREFVDLGERLCGEDPNSETKRVWFQHLYNRFLYERDPGQQQLLLAETMSDMRQWAAQLSPLDPGRSAVAFLYRVDREAYSDIQNQFGRDTPAKALELVRTRAENHFERIDHEGYEDFCLEHGKETHVRALDRMRELRPEFYGEIKGETEVELALSAADYLQKNDPDAYQNLSGYEPRKLQNAALEILREGYPEVYDLCHRMTPEKFEREIETGHYADQAGRGAQTTYFDPESLRAPSQSAEDGRPEAQGGRTYFSLQDARESGLSFAEMKAAESSASRPASDYQTEQPTTTMAQAFERLFNSESYQATQQEAAALEDRDPNDPDYEDPAQFAAEIEEGAHELAEDDPGNSLRESSRMSADYVVMGSVYQTPPAPEGLLERYDSARRVFENFDDHVTDRIWSGSTVRELRDNFNKFMTGVVRVREMGEEVRAHFGIRPDPDLRADIKTAHSEITRLASDVLSDSRGTYVQESTKELAAQLVGESAKGKSVRDFLGAGEEFVHALQVDERPQRERPEAGESDRRLQDLSDRIWGLMERVQTFDAQSRPAEPGTQSQRETLEARIAVNELIINQRLAEIRREAGIERPDAQPQNTSPIRTFTGRYEFLSDSYMPQARQEVRLDGQDYPSAAHAMLAAQTTNPEQREAIRTRDYESARLLTLDAREMGRALTGREDAAPVAFDRRDDWHVVRNQVAADIQNQVAENRATVSLDGADYPSVAHAMAAARTQDPEAREAIRSAPTPAQAASIASQAPQRADWAEVRDSVMRDLQNQKFEHPEMREKLLSTGARPIISDTGKEAYSVVPVMEGGRIEPARVENNTGPTARDSAIMQVREEIKSREPERDSQNAVEPGLVVCATGHRPDKLFGYTQEGHRLLVDYAKERLSEIKPREVVSGMALGWDQAVAQAAVELNIPLTAAVPFKGQESRWPEESKRQYNDILSKASQVVTVSEGDYTAKKMDVRNRWMVDHSDAALSLWNGTPGGTANCVAYARDEEKPILQEWQGLQRFAEERGAADKLKEPQLLDGVYRELQEETAALKETLAHLPAEAPRQAEAPGQTEAQQQQQQDAPEPHAAPVQESRDESRPAAEAGAPSQDAPAPDGRSRDEEQDARPSVETLERERESVRLSITAVEERRTSNPVYREQLLSSLEYLNTREQQLSQQIEAERALAPEPASGDRGQSPDPELQTLGDNIRAIEDERREQMEAGLGRIRDEWRERLESGDRLLNELEQTTTQTVEPDRAQATEAARDQTTNEADRAQTTNETGRAQAPNRDDSHRLNIVITDAQGGRVPVVNVEVWKHYEAVSDRLRQAGEQPNVAVYSEPKGEYISEPAPEEVQLQRHFHERLTYLTEEEHPELGRLARANDAQNRGRADRFLDAAHVMKEGVDHQTGQTAQQYLDRVQQESKAARGQADRQGTLSKQDIKLLVTINQQAYELRLNDKLRGLSPEERRQAEHQERQSQRARQEASQSKEQAAYDVCRKELDRTKNPGHVGFFFARTLNQTLKDGRPSDLYETFQSLPKTRRDELHQLARERRTDMRTQGKLKEVAAITMTSPALQGYLAAMRESERPGVSHKAVLNEAWEKVAARIEAVRPGTSQAVAEHVAAARETQEKLQILKTVQGQTWAAARQEADRNVSERLAPSVASFRDRVFDKTVRFDGLTYPTGEHALLAAQTKDPAQREAIRNTDSFKDAAELASNPQKMGRAVNGEKDQTPVYFNRRDDWEAVRAEITADIRGQQDNQIKEADKPIGLSRDLRDLASTLGAHMVAADDRGAYAVYTDPASGTNQNEYLPEPIADHVRELTAIAQAGDTPGGGPNAAEEQYILDNVSKDTRQGLVAIERGITEYKLELANQFVDIDIAANLQQDLSRETVQQAVPQPAQQPELATMNIAEAAPAVPGQAMAGQSQSQTGTLTLESPFESQQARSARGEDAQHVMDDEARPDSPMHDLASAQGIESITDQLDTPDIDDGFDIDF